MATAILGAVHRVVWIGLGQPTLQQENLLLGVTGIGLGLVLMSPPLEKWGLWPTAPESATRYECRIVWSATVVLGLVVTAWVLEATGLWLLVGDDNAAWLRIAATSKVGSAAPLDQGVAVAVLLTVAKGSTRLAVWCLGVAEQPSEIVPLAVAGTYAALAVALPTIAHRALMRRKVGTSRSFLSALLMQVTVVMFAIEAVRYGHLTALLAGVALVASLPREVQSTHVRYRAVRWVPFACSLSIWLGTVPLSLAFLGAIMVVSTVPWRWGWLAAVILGGLLTLFVGRRFALLLPWGGSVVQVRWLAVVAVLLLTGLVLARRRPRSLPLTVVTVYTAALAVLNLWRSGSIDYGVSKAIWILMPLALLEVLTTLGAELRDTTIGGPKTDRRELSRPLRVLVVALLFVAVASIAVPTARAGLRLGDGTDVPRALHWRDLGSAQARGDLPLNPVGCIVIDSWSRPVLASDALYRCNRFVTAVSAGDDRLGPVFRSYAAGGVGLGGLLETIGNSGVSPSRILLIDGDGLITSTTLRDVAN